MPRTQQKKDAPKVRKIVGAHEKTHHMPKVPIHDRVTTSKPPAAVTRKGMQQIRSATLRRLLTKGGITHVSRTAYGPLRVILGNFMKKFAKYSHIQARNAGRKTITMDDVMISLGKLGHTFYGAEAH